MNEKDISEKTLEYYNDVFADIINVLLFSGKRVVDEADLEDQAARSGYKIDGQVHEIERDVAKRWKNKNFRIACIGFENQTRADNDMPLRVMEYDAAEYRWQLNGKTSERYPVITLVLHFDPDNHWNKSKSLYERLDIMDELKPFVNDYRINLFEIAYLTPEQVKLFKSDFRFVADFFVQTRMNGRYVASHETINHVQETLHMMSVLTGNHVFERAQQKVNSNQEGNAKEAATMNMADIFEPYIKEGEKKGLAQGLEQGLEQGQEQAKCEMARKMYATGMTIENIAQIADVSVDKVREWLGDKIA